MFSTIKRLSKSSGKRFRAENMIMVFVRFKVFKIFLIISCSWVVIPVGNSYSKRTFDPVKIARAIERRYFSKLEKIFGSVWSDV